MPSTVPIPRLTDKDLVFTPQPSAFSQLTSDTIGDFGTVHDGFDMQYSIPAGLVADDIAHLGDMSQNLADSDFADGQFEGDVWAPIDAAITPFMSDGDNLMDAFNTAVVPPPQPPPPGPPPGGNGGGGGGGGGGGNGGGGGGGGGGVFGGLPCPTGYHPTPDGGCEKDPVVQQP